MKQLTILFFLLSIFLNAIYAKEMRIIKVKFTNAQTKEAVQNVAFYYDYKDKKNNFSFLKNFSVQDSILEIEAQQKIFYTAICSGFKQTKGTILPSQEAVYIPLNEDVIHLNNFVITANKHQRPIKLSAITTQVLGGKSLVEAGYSDIQHALRQETPGMNIQKVGFGNDISMQGLDARHVLFLQDGERMTGDMAGNLDYERFNIHSIERIEIVKGASSTLYGSRASGAVINLISKKTTKPFELQAGGRFAQYNQRNYKDASPKDFLYMFEKNADKLNAQAWLSAGAKTKAFTSQTDVLYHQSDGFYLYQTQNDQKVYTKEANNFLPHDIVLNAIAERPPMGIEGSQHVQVAQKLYFEPNKNFSLQTYGTMFFMNRYDLIQDMTFSQVRNVMAGIKAKYKVKDWLAINVSLHNDFYSRFKRHEQRNERKKVYDSHIFEPRLSITSNYFTSHSIILGLEHTSDELTSDRFINRIMSKRTLTETELFVQDEWQWNDKWLFSMGIRTNFSKAFGFMYMPKLAVKYSLKNYWAFRLSASKGYRAPSIAELFFNWDHLGMFQIRGNEKLKPEENHYFSVGTEFNNKHFFANINMYGNFFRKKIEGIWHIYDLQYNFEYANLSNQRLLGLETFIKWTLLDNLVVNASYSYVNINKHNGIQVNASSPHAATASIDYSIKKKNYQIKSIFSVSYMGEKNFDVQDRVYVPEYNKSYNAYFRCHLPDYILCNITLVQTFANKIKFTCGVENVFNYVPKTLGSGLTMFNVPATNGARAYVQLEFLIDNIKNYFK